MGKTDHGHQSISWDDSRAIFGIAATHLGVEVAQIEYLHNVGYPPEDLRSQRLQALLLQMRLPAPAQCSSEDFLRIILLDIEHYGTTPFSWPSLRRTSKWLPSVINRRSLLRLLSLEFACQADATRCQVCHNDELIDARRRAPMRFAHADNVKVAVPSDEIPSDCQAAPNIHIDAGDAVEPEFSSLLQTIQETHKMLSDQEVQPPAFVCDRERHAEEHRDGPGQDIDLDALQDAWHRAVVSLDSSTSSTGVNFETWYVNGMLHPRCSESRSVNHAEDPALWSPIIMQAWLDLLDSDGSVQIELIRPEVEPRLHGGHILVIQHMHPRHRAVLLTSYWYAATSE